MTNPTRKDTPEVNWYKEFMLSHIPEPHIGCGADAAPLALFLACNDSYYVNGQVITLDGGMTSHQPQRKEDMALSADTIR